VFGKISSTSDAKERLQHGWEREGTNLNNPTRNLRISEISDDEPYHRSGCDHNIYLRSDTTYTQLRRYKVHTLSKYYDLESISGCTHAKQLTLYCTIESEATFNTLGVRQGMLTEPLPMTSMSNEYAYP
jgi:hypothetical protein